MTHSGLHGANTRALTNATTWKGWATVIPTEPWAGGFAGVTMAELVSAELRQTDPGRVSLFGMKLAAIRVEDRDEILRVLGENGVAPSKPPKRYHP